MIRAKNRHKPCTVGTNTKYGGEPPLQRWHCQSQIYLLVHFPCPDLINTDCDESKTSIKAGGQIDTKEGCTSQGGSNVWWSSICWHLPAQLSNFHSGGEHSCCIVVLFCSDIDGVLIDQCWGCFGNSSRAPLILGLPLPAWLESEHNSAEKDCNSEEVLLHGGPTVAL